MIMTFFSYTKIVFEKSFVSVLLRKIPSSATTLKFDKLTKLLQEKHFTHIIFNSIIIMAFLKCFF